MLETVAGFQLSPQQARLWLLQDRDAAAYRAQCVVSLQGDIQLQRLEEAVSIVVQRHEILRTSFRSQAGMFLPLQVITEQVPALSRFDFSHLSTREQDAAIEELFAAAEMDFALVILSPDQHRLLINLPSLCADQKSLGQIVWEIQRAYANEAKLDEPAQYTVVSQWLNDLLESEEAQIGKDYWREQHSSATTTSAFRQDLQDFQDLHVNPENLVNPVAKLPFELDASGSFAWRSVTNVLTPTLVEKLDRSVERLGTTPRTFLLNCWHALLYRLTGETNVIVGTGFDGRSDDDLAEAVGLFARYLPVRSYIEENSRVTDVLQKLDQAVLEAYDWQECFTWNPTKSETHFAYCFDYEEQPTGYQPGNVTFSITRQHACIDRFNLKLACVRRGHSLAAEFYFDENSFSQPDVERLAEEFQTLLESAVDNPGASFDELAMLGDAERHKLLVEFNDTRSDYAKDSTLHELFEQQVARTPEHIAVVFRNQKLTFAELNARSNQLARHLQTLGVSSETFVAVCMERSLEMIVGLLATLKAGAAYVPLDPESPSERQAGILRDIHAPVLLTQQSLITTLPETEATVICVDTNPEDLTRYSEENLPRLATANNLAYVIFTSGSTGVPKGVMISHRAICNHMDWFVKHFEIDEHETILQKTPFFFDASVSEFFAPLITGGRLLLAEPGGHRDTNYLVGLMAHEKVTTLQLVPSMLRALLEEPNLTQVSSLKRVICAGEALTFELRDKFQSLLAARLYNLYGPTEAAIDVTSWDCAFKTQRDTVPIGRPIANTRVYVLDTRLNPVAFGASGELYLGGDGLARGYLQRPELTGERFIPDPFSTEPGARLYKTGDLVRYLQEGALEFLGRSDDQVKIRGFRIEPGEVEATLNQHMLVRHAVVTVAEDNQGHKRLIAYLVPKNVSRLPNGMQIVHLNQNETDVLYDEIFAQRTYLKHGVTLADGDCVFDVGANIGLFTLFVQQHCRNPKVYSFEPVPATFETLKTNVALYNVNAEVFNCGISRHNVMTKVTSYPLMSSMSGFYANRLEDEQVTRAFLSNQDTRLHSYADELIDGRFRSETFDCELRTISDVISEHSVEKIDLLKVDAEKSELDVLNGIRKDDWKKIRQIVIEVHDIDGRLHDITAILDQHGFRHVVEQDPSQTNTGLYNIYAVHPASARKATAETPAPLSSSFPGLSNSELRAFLDERLPAYMVPSAFVKLDAIPLLPSGKINRKALPSPDWTRTETDDTYEAPRTSIEKRLADIWIQTLGIERVGIHDNFFALGGDSILGIQLITKANQAGFRLTIKQLFQYKTIAALSEVAGSNALPLEVEEDVPSGPVRLTPAQLWFFEQQLADQHHFNQSVLVEVQPAEPRVFEQIFAHLVEHHDALRLRFVYEDGEWRQAYASNGEPVPFYWEDLSDCSETEQQERIESRTVALQSILSLENGPLMRAVVFNLGSGRPNVLLMVIHHLVVDGISWRILTEDFETAYGQVIDGRPIQLPAKTASFKRWSERLAEYAQSREIQNEREYWLSRREAPVLPVDFALGDNTVASTETISVSLTVDETTALLQDVPRAYNTQINDVLLAALVLAFSNWTGSTTLLVDLEGHGRETIDDKLDISRTVGWFTSVFPVFLETPDGKEFGEVLKSIKEQLRHVPNRGLGHGLLRYLNADREVAARLSSLPRAEVSFNYLGKFDEGTSSVIGARRQVSAPMRSPRGLRQYLLEINGGVNEGQLRLSWSYSTNRHQGKTIEQLANDFTAALRSLINHCVNLNERSYTPSDFPDADLNQAELDDLMAELAESI